MATISEMFEAERKKKRDAANALENLTREEKIRAVHPGVRELWEQYQTMLALVDDGSLQVEEDAQAEIEMMKAKSRRNMMKMMAG